MPESDPVSVHMPVSSDGFPPAPGKRFGDAKDDWRLWHGSIPVVLRKWYDRGYKVAIISNQMGVGTGKVDQKMVSVQAAALLLISRSHLVLFVADSQQ